ncbi:MAG: preprotein translocase subunit SecG [Brevinematales bacterium]
MWFTIFLVLFIIVVVLLIPLILMQTGSGAQSGMFGSDFATGVFGAKTNEVLVKITKWMVAAFFVFALALGYIKMREYKLGRPQVQGLQNTEQTTQKEAQSESSQESSQESSLPLLPQK